MDPTLPVIVDRLGEVNGGGALTHNLELTMNVNALQREGVLRNLL